MLLLIIKTFNMHLKTWRISWLLLAGVLVAFTSMAQQSKSYKALWKQYDSLMNYGLEKDAEAVIQQVLTRSRKDNDREQYLKAVIYRTQLKVSKADQAADAFPLVSSLEEAADNNSERALIYAIQAVTYADYFQNNRWQILSRTNVGSSNEDIQPAAWSEVQFVDTIYKLFRKALDYRGELERLPVSRYESLLTRNDNGKAADMDLYEFLLQEYRQFNMANIHLFSQDFQQYKTADTSWFTLDPAVFMNKKIEAAAPVDIKKHTIESFQLLTAYYQSKKYEARQAQLDFERILYLKEHFLFPDEKALISRVMEKFAVRYAAYPVAALALKYNIEQQLQDKETEPLAAVEAYERLIRKYPNSPASQELFNALSQLKAQQFSLKGEEVVPPGRPFKILLEYRNVSACRLLVLPFIERKEKERFGDYRRRVMAQPVISTYTTDLPAAADLTQHSTELKIDGLPTGKYFIIPDQPQQGDDEYNWVKLEFQVSGIAYVRNDDQVTILDRTTGRPLANAVLKLHPANPIRQLKIYTADKNGVLHVNDIRNDYYNWNRFTITHDNDKLTGNSYWGYYNRPEEKSSAHTFIFTDRDIYRPGQTIYFKGIMVNKTGNNARVVPQQQIKAGIHRNYYDKAIETVELTTNEFGSVQGTFKAPENGYTGDYIIKIGTGQVTVKVEEYKRPKFFVTFDTLKGSYFVNDGIEVHGVAQAYAGNNINDASVEYAVERNVRFPFPWRCYWWPVPENRSVTVAAGTTVTDAGGRFTIPFKAVPDNTNPELWPVFTYTVNIKVTDLNGETHEFSQNVSAAYRDALLTAAIPEDGSGINLRDVAVRVTNVNNITVNNPYSVRVAKLEAPKRLLISRLWQTPDQYLYDEATFRSFFPDDVYKKENEKESWKELETTFTQTYTGPRQLNLVDMKAFDRNGWYVVELSTKDIKGQEVTQKYYTHVVTDWNKPVEKEILIVANREKAFPGDQVKVKVMKQAEGAQERLLMVSRNNEQIRNRTDFTVTEAHRGGVFYKAYYISNNRLYESSRYITIPFDNKELSVKLLTERSKLLPGSKEKWSYAVSGNKSEAYSTELLAGMYDASLDALYVNGWNYSNLMSTVPPYLALSGSFGQVSGSANWYREFSDRTLQGLSDYDSAHIKLYSLPRLSFVGGPTGGTKWVGRAARGDVNAFDAAPAPSAKEESIASGVAVGDSAAPADTAGKAGSSAGFAPRTNLNETAFFYPQLRTNDKGEVSFEFTMPEALTTWKWRTFTHTTDWKTGYLEGEVQTQKDLMVQPNIPRVFRQTDNIVLSSKVVNLTATALSAEAWVEILDARTLQSLALPFRLEQHKQQLQLPAGQSREVSWNIHIPESVYQPVILRVFAKAGNHTDGEEHYIPVITNRMLVTETLPLPMSGSGTRQFRLEKLLSANSSTLLNKGITVEYTANPTWYVIQALPYLAAYPYDCAEQVFSKFYANAIAADIVQRSPKIEQVFREWSINSEDALMSNLQKNEQLKTALLEETPWVLEAGNEAEQKQRIAALFEARRLSRELDKSLAQLEKKQMSNGAFSWFEGMQADRYITQTIALGLLKMQDKNITPAKDSKARAIADRAMPFLEQRMVEDYQNLVRKKIKLDQNNLSPAVIQYLYAFALSKKDIPAPYRKEYDYYIRQVQQYWKDQSLLLQAYAAEIMQQRNEHATAGLIIESLRQRAIVQEETGMYWKQNQGYNRWYEAPVETQAALIQAFKKIGSKGNEIAQMQTWLLKNKQTNRWHSTRATVDASYALFADNMNITEQQPKVQIQLGDIAVSSQSVKQQAGTGYFQSAIEGKQVQPQMGNITVTVSDMKAGLPSWGAVYWQYFEQYDKITAADIRSLKVSKEIFKAEHTPTGVRLKAISGQAPVTTGDKIVVRLTVTSDRDLEYVHIKDTRAACFEPKDVLSRYLYKDRLGYYQSTRDISTNFFVDFLPKGTYVLEYEVYANAKGTYSSGIASVQCMYAPEFAAHSAGSVLEVK